MAIVTYALLVAGRNREMSKAMLKLKSMQKSGMTVAGFIVPNGCH